MICDLNKIIKKYEENIDIKFYLLVNYILIHKFLVNQAKV